MSDIRVLEYVTWFFGMTLAVVSLGIFCGLMAMICYGFWKLR